MDWIDIKDKLPPIGVEVNVSLVPNIRYPEGLVTSLRRCVAYEGATGYWWDNAYGHGNWHRGDQVSHWQPLPKPPTNT